jgi:uncharacterized OB-fold protein
VSDAEKKRPEPKPRPAPGADPETEPFWNAVNEGRLLVQRCRSCGTHQLYPRWRCLRCRGQVEWVEAGGGGTVYSFTVIRQNFSRSFRHLIPYVVTLVDLDEGPRVMSNLVGCDPADVRIGMPVRVRFESVSDEASVPLFEPAAQS